MRLCATSASGALALLAILLPPSPAAAQVRPDTIPADSATYELAEVVVTTRRAATTTGGTSAIRIVPDSMRLPPAPTLAQVLREMPFVQVRENSRGEAELSLRGSESRQVAVLLDGVPLTLGWDHRTDASIIPVTGAQQIMLVRGLHSLLYGPNVLGGVVEVGVAHGAPPLEERARAGFSAGVDHVGGRSLGMVAGTPIQLESGGLSVRAGVGYRTRPGSALASGVPDPGDGGRDELRTNSDLDLLDGFAAIRYHGESGEWLGFSASGYGAERGVPPELHVTDPRLWRYPTTSRAIGVISGGTGHRRTVFGGVGDLEVSIGLDRGEQRIESFATREYLEMDGTESSDAQTVTARLLGDHTLPAGAALRGALTYADVRHEEVLDSEPANLYRQRLWSAAAEIAAPLAAETRVSAGLVIDGADTPESGDKPPLGTLTTWGGRLGISQVADQGRLRLHAAVSQRARFPSLRELYSGALGRFAPNPNLQPERLLGAEAGITSRRGELELQAVGFHHRLSDAIVRTRTEDRRFRRENRDQILSTGVELLAEWSPRPSLSLLGDLMLQDVRVNDPTVPADDRRPEHQPGFRAGLNAAVPLAQRLRGLARAQYTGRQFCVDPELGGDRELEGSGQASVGLERNWQLRRGRGGVIESLRASFWADNAGDSAVYDQCGLPQPGRTFRLQVQVG